MDDGKTKMSKKAKAAAARAAAAVEHLLPDLRIGKNETDHLRSDQILLVDIQKSKCVYPRLLLECAAGHMLWEGTCFLSRV